MQGKFRDAGVSIPRQRGGLYCVSRSKRLGGGANATPILLSHHLVAGQRHRFI
jgi:hypothetical protein